MHYPNFCAMLTLLDGLWSLPVPSLAPVSLNLLQSPICQSLHLMTTLVLSFVLFNASQLGIPIVRPVNVRKRRLWKLPQQGKPQFDAVLTKPMNNQLIIHSSVNINMHYSDGRNISITLTLVGF